MGATAAGIQRRRSGGLTGPVLETPGAVHEGESKEESARGNKSMAGLKPVDDNNLSPALKTIVKRFRDDPDYVNGLKIFAHQSEFAEIAWSAYTQLLDRGKLPR